MNYDEALTYIHSVNWMGTRPGLSRVRALLSVMGDPQKKLKFIHIVGTNGKGSTAAMLSSILVQAGYRTGLYTSPYIVAFTERMQVDGAPISDEALAALTAYIKPLADELDEHPTEFEMVTAIAMQYFAESGCEIVVLEAGMGGEFDATNVIDAPEAAIVTNIGLDHTQFLGSTVEEIARTKAGVIKSGCDCVLYHQDARVEEVIAAVCAEKGVPLRIASTDGIESVDNSLEGQVFDWEGLRSLEIPLLGAHQLNNAAVVLTAVEALKEHGWQISEESVRRGLRKVQWPGRFQVAMTEPTFIIDGGHNPQCLDALVAALRDYLPGKRIAFLAGCMADKDYKDMFKKLAPFAERFVTVTPDNPRALDAKALAAYLTEEGFDAVAADTVGEGVAEAIRSVGEDGAVVACGSLYMIGDILESIEKLIA